MKVKEDGLISLHPRIEERYLRVRTGFHFTYHVRVTEDKKLIEGTEESQSDHPLVSTILTLFLDQNNTLLLSGFRKKYEDSKEMGAAGT